MNLRKLAIASHVPLDDEWVPTIRFNLRSFTSVGGVIGAWVRLLHLQPQLEELVLYSEFFAQPPGPDIWPVLRHVTARVFDVFRFAEHHPLLTAHVWQGPPGSGDHLGTRDLVRFGRSVARLTSVRATAPQWLRLSECPASIRTVESLVLDEDSSWRHEGCEVG
jgi:hypothetical protein